MDSEVEKMIKENLELTRENNDILKRIRRTQRHNQIGQAVYWLFLIGLSIGAFYFLQPYISTLLTYYHEITGSNINLQNLK